eukprot:gnl/TRDRNA2_/TRDRNA2_158666_c0_seq2.p1 gnl/TRDRNA2_/TRDRNA2_158666_c0~~gnl/TRDRNA2_/TRDRNA2_158666_c0_seq2.p1  ORF type:complete len:225 (-),score=38.51 gnl/TRDRNA2_/TRDRNA2_158666_c0_seq2:95-718(-)
MTCSVAIAIPWPTHARLLPSGTDVPAEALEIVLAALWRHPFETKVVNSVCFTLRAFLEPRRGREVPGAPELEGTNGNSVVARAAAALRERDAGSGLRQVLENYSEEDDSGSTLLEDAVYSLGLVEGVNVVLKTLAESDKSEGALRAGGLKALFEIGRSFSELFPAQTASDATTVAEMLVGQAAGEPCEVEVQRHAELLRGMLYTIRR